MLRSSNPILSKQDAFTPAAPQQYNQNPYDQSPAGYRQYPGYPQAPVESLEGRMTFDDVVTKTAVTMGVLIITAALAWMFVPDALYFPALIGSGLIGFIVVMIVSFRRKVSPGLVLLYAGIEGIFIGMISKVFESLYSGIVVQAVIGTFAAAAVTLAAYKFFNIRVTPKFRKVVIIATIAFAVALLINFLLRWWVSISDSLTAVPVRSACWLLASPCSARRLPCSTWCSTSTTSSKVSPWARQRVSRGVAHSA